MIHFFIVCMTRNENIFAHRFIETHLCVSFVCLCYCLVCRSREDVRGSVPDRASRRLVM